MQASASEIVGPGWALVGDAAHVIHPLAGQGLNLGLGDVAALARVIAARESWRSLGDEALLRRYARARLWPTRAMAGAVDGLWQLFSAPAPGLRELRNHGMTLVNHLSPLKRWLVARALGALRSSEPPPNVELTMTAPRLAPRLLAATALRRRLCLGMVPSDAAIRKNFSPSAIRRPARSTRSTKTPIAGLYEVRVGADIFYTDDQANYILFPSSSGADGHIIDTRNKTDVTQQRLDKLSFIDVPSLPFKDAIALKQGNGSRRLVVFEDPNCHYCKDVDEKKPGRPEGRDDLHLPVPDPPGPRTR